MPGFHLFWGNVLGNCIGMRYYSVWWSQECLNVTSDKCQKKKFFCRVGSTSWSRTADRIRGSSPSAAYISRITARVAGRQVHCIARQSAATLPRLYAGESADTQAPSALRSRKWFARPITLPRCDDYVYNERGGQFRGGLLEICPPPLCAERFGLPANLNLSFRY